MDKTGGCDQESEAGGLSLISRQPGWDKEGDVEFDRDGEGEVSVDQIGRFYMSMIVGGGALNSARMVLQG